MARNPVVFQNGTLVQKATVEIDGNVYEVEPAQYEGTTPLSAYNLNRLQDNLYDYVDEKKFEVLHGTTVPSSSLGEDGDIYFQHS